MTADPRQPEQSQQPEQPEQPDQSSGGPDPNGSGAVGALVARLTERPDLPRTASERGRDLGSLARAMAGSARRAGRASVLGGGWLVDLFVDTAPRIPVRDLATLRAHHPGLDADDLAQALISGAAKSTGAVGAAGGALAAVQFTAPPTLLSSPVQLAAETLLVAAVEVKLIAELHEVYGVPVPGPTTRARMQTYLVAWTERRGIDPLSPGALRLSLGAAAKRSLRKRLVRRAGRNLSTLGPMMSGAVAGSVVNHRETRRLGEQVRDDVRRIGRSADA
jgi:hypothetical protein